MAKLADVMDALTLAGQKATAASDAVTAYIASHPDTAADLDTVVAGLTTLGTNIDAITALVTPAPTA